MRIYESPYEHKKFQLRQGSLANGFKEVVLFEEILFQK